MKDPYRTAEKWTKCPKCKQLLGWNKEDGLKGQSCSCGYTFKGTERNGKIKVMKGFKVIQRCSRFSARAINWYGFSCKWGVKYPLNKTTFPNVEGTKLFFFKDRADAENFISIGEIVVPCVATNAVKIKWISRRSSDVNTFWKDKKEAPKDICKEAPEGTWLADSITCLE